MWYHCKKGMILNKYFKIIWRGGVQSLKYAVVAMALLKLVFPGCCMNEWLKI